MLDRIRVFVDSSVLIAAAISARGSARELLLRAFDGAITLFVSRLVLEETERNLRRKAPEALSAFFIFRDTLPAGRVDPPADLISQAGQVVDAKDAPIVAAAVEARALYLATYDRRHLLSQRDQIEARFGIIATTSDEIVAVLGDA